MLERANRKERDERPTSNVQRPMSNEKQKRRRIFKEKSFGYDKEGLNSSVRLSLAVSRSFDVGRSMFDVRRSGLFSGCCFFILFFCMLLSSQAEEISPLKYARGFRVEALADGCRLATVLPPWKGDDTVYRYLLVPRGHEVPENHPEAQVVTVPVERFVTLSSSQLPYLDAAGKMDLLVGLGGTEHISTMSARRLVAAGKIHEVGIFTNVRMEALLDLSPDIVMASASGSAYDPHPKLLEAGMPVVLTLAHIEKSPLGRCEWIKFLAMFIGTEEHAEALFEEIAGRYEALVRKTAGISHRPGVITGAPIQGKWDPRGSKYLPGLIRDAGGRPLWEPEGVSGYRKPMDIEAMYNLAMTADAWINTSTWESLEDAFAADPRFADVPAIQNRRLYNNNAKTNPWGGNDYWESGMLYPEQLLSDLIAILHPGLLPGHELIYYRRLEGETRP